MWDFGEKLLATVKTASGERDGDEGAILPAEIPVTWPFGRGRLRVFRRQIIRKYADSHQPGGIGTMRSANTGETLMTADRRRMGYCLTTVSVLALTLGCAAAAPALAQTAEAPQTEDKAGTSPD